MANGEEDHHDFSQYELARLERIKRNTAYLESLGLLDHPRSEKKKPKKRKKKSHSTGDAPVRFSKRLRQAQEQKFTSLLRL